MNGYRKQSLVFHQNMEDIQMKKPFMIIKIFDLNDNRPFPVWKQSIVQSIDNKAFRHVETLFV